MYQDVPVRSSCVISAAMRPADTSIQSQRSALVEGGHAKNSLLVEHDLINDLRIDLHLQRELFVFRYDGQREQVQHLRLHFLPGLRPA